MTSPCGARFRIECSNNINASAVVPTMINANVTTLIDHNPTLPSNDIVSGIQTYVSQLIKNNK